MLHDWVNKKIGPEDLIKKAEFVLKNNYFEFNTKVKQQLAETAMGKSAPQCACIFMDHFDTLFPESQVYKWLVWFQYIDNVGLMVKKGLVYF